MFFDMKKDVYSESVFNALYIEIKQILKKFPSDKMNGKNAFFFLSQAPTQLQAEAQGFSTFDSVSFLSKFIFYQQNAWALSL